MTRCWAMEFTTTFQNSYFRIPAGLQHICMMVWIGQWIGGCLFRKAALQKSCGRQKRSVRYVIRFLVIRLFCEESQERVWVY